MVAHSDRARFHAETAQQWRDWLVENHEKTDGVWLVTWRTASGKPRLRYEDSVEEGRFRWSSQHPFQPRGVVP